MNMSIIEAPCLFWWKFGRVFMNIVQERILSVTFEGKDGASVEQYIHWHHFQIPSLLPKMTRQSPGSTRGIINSCQEFSNLTDFWPDKNKNKQKNSHSTSFVSSEMTLRLFDKFHRSFSNGTQIQVFLPRTWPQGLPHQSLKENIRERASVLNLHNQNQRQGSSLPSSSA